MMRKLFSFLMLAMVFAFASCMKEEVDLGSGSEETIRFSVNLPQQGMLSRATFSDPDLGINPMRVLLYVMYEGNVVDKQEIPSHVFKNSEGGVNPATFDLRLVTDKDYTVAVWADFGVGTEKYYVVGTEEVEGKTIPTVEMVTNEGKINGSNNARDAYFAVETVNFKSANESKSMTLKRPFGLVRIQTLDYEEDAVVNAGLLPTAYEMTVAAQTKMNLFNGELMGDDNSLTISGEVTDVATSGELSFDYFFAPAEVEGNAEEQQGKLHNFTVKYTKDGDEIVSYDFTNIPVRRNYKTNISGNILTKKGNISVTVEQDWTGSISENLEVAPGDLQTVLDGLIVTELIDANIVVTGKLPIDASYTLPAVVEGSSISIVLAGAEGNVIFGSADFKGSLNVSNTGDAIDLTVNVPAGNAVIGSGNWSSLTVTTKENTCVIEEGTTVETLIVNGGNVKIYGTVAPEKITIKNADSKIFWGAGTEDRLRTVLAYDAKVNHGVILTGDVASTKLDVNNGAQSNQDGFKIAGNNINSSNEFVENPYDGYVFDGNGHALSGAAYNNIMAVYANDVTIKNLEIYQETASAKANAGLSLYRVNGIVLENVHIHNCGKAGLIVNASQASAEQLMTEGNAWGGVNVSKGGAPTGGPRPEFTFDNTCEFKEEVKVYVDLDRTEDEYAVNTPEGWRYYVLGTKAFFTNESVNPKDHSVSTLDELKEILADVAINGGKITIEEGAEIVVTGLSALPIYNPTTIVINGKITSEDEKFYIENNSNLVIEGIGTMELKRRVVENRGTLVVNGGIYRTHTNNGGTALWNNAENAEMTLNNVNVQAEFFAVAGNGKITINGGEFVSTSSNKYGSWAYCVRAQGACEMIINDATIQGVQGAIACIESSRITLNNVKAMAKNSEAGKQDAFYALYAATLGVIEVNSGEFYSDRTPCCYASDDDMTGSPYGAFVLKGGKYSSMPKNHGGSDWWAEEGYKFVETGDATYPYEIVKE